MTIATAIDRVDTLKPNHQSREMKIAWLSELDGLINREIILKHVHPPEAEDFEGYTPDTDDETVLLAPHPYDEVYTYYLMAQVSLQNQEIAKYNNEKGLFANSYEMLNDYWTREHMPLSVRGELWL